MATDSEALRDGNGSGRHSLPPGDQTFQLDHEAPASNDGSFFVEADVCAVPVQADKKPPVPVPKDDETGVTLLLVPRDLSTALPSEIHPHHPKGKLWKADRAKMSPTLRILRSTFVQFVLARYHNGDSPEAFHRYVLNMDAALGLPEEEADQLGEMTLNQIGYVPRQVIDTEGGELVTRARTDAEEHILRTPRPITPLRTQGIEDFRDKWFAGRSLTAVADILRERQAQRAQYSYRDIDNGHSYVRPHMTDVFLERELMDDTTGYVRGLLERNDPEADKELLDLVVAAITAQVTVRGTRLSSLYPSLNRHGLLYKDMPDTVEPFLRFRFANPLGGVALSAKRRDQLLGREETPAA